MDGAWVHVPRFPVPHGWNKRTVEILIEIPYGNPGYPALPPDWFWTDRNLRTSDGRGIGHFLTQDSYNNSGDRIFLERGWGHFCVHMSRWQPASGLRLREGHTLLSYLELIEAIFRDYRTLTR
jgi:hypothetical protein